jgi:hypothetical protein
MPDTRRERTGNAVDTRFSFCSQQEAAGRSAIAKLIRDLVDMGKGKLAFSVRCGRCKHKAVLLPMSLAMRFGMAHPIERVYGQLVCSKCGARGGALDVGMVGR